MLEFIRDAKIKEEEEKKAEIKAREEQKEKVEFAIWDEKQASAQSKKVFFKLIEHYDEIALIACDEWGEEISQGNILSISSDGRINLFGEVNTNIGLQLNGNGKVITK